MSITQNRFYVDDQTGDRFESDVMPEGWIEVDSDGSMFISLPGMTDYRTEGDLGVFMYGVPEESATQKHFGDATEPADPYVALENWHMYVLTLLGGPGVVPPVWDSSPGATTPPVIFSGRYKAIYDFIVNWTP